MRTPRMYFHSRFPPSPRVAALIIPRSATMQTDPIPNRFFNRSTMGTRLFTSAQEMSRPLIRLSDRPTELGEHPLLCPDQDQVASVNPMYSPSQGKNPILCELSVPMKLSTTALAQYFTLFSTT